MGGLGSGGTGGGPYYPGCGKRHYWNDCEFNTQDAQRATQRPPPLPVSGPGMDFNSSPEATPVLLVMVCCLGLGFLIGMAVYA